MDPLLIAASAGMRSRMDSLDMLANNLANAGTSGFKMDRELMGLHAGDQPDVQRQWTDFSQGALEPTSNLLDLGLAGEGFFALNSKAGVTYTRSGAFQLNAAGEITTPDGMTLRNRLDSGRPIRLDPNKDIAVDRDGSISQGGKVVARIEVARAASPQSILQKMGGTYFASTGTGMTSVDTDAPEIKQGVIERSNVPVADSAVRLVSVMRRFEMLQRAASTGAEMNKKATDDIARVNG